MAAFLSQEIGRIEFIGGSSRSRLAALVLSRHTDPTKGGV
jgi:hypothetical protein